ncbi:hypothetical protein AVEN_249439-1 [Araneus ventricosus]|uniref:Uncharacterized protein n=1 Tax=Araneus ventricosus TaxID=182803 RepID=A0A4Y2REW4_ARAVE|nr:hypothetical protein AVEN_249439-1 [Araneus ventricosus]
MSTVQHQARLAVSGSTKPTVESHFRLEYRNCRSPSKNSIRSWYEKFKGTGDMYHKKGTGRPWVSDEDVKRMKKTFIPELLIQALNGFLPWRPTISML